MFFDLNDTDAETFREKSLEALDSLFSFLVEENDQKFLEITELIWNIVKKEIYPTLEQLIKIKPLIDHYNEDIQNNAINIYQKTLTDNLNLLDSELDFCIAKLSEFEIVIRKKFLDFLYNLMPIDEEKDKKIILGMKKLLSDESWKIRLKVIEYFNKLINTHTKVFKSVRSDFDVILRERDIDVLREGRDFLVNLIYKTYDTNDFRKLINSIEDRNWYAQGKILWIVGKIGRKDLGFIMPVTGDIIKFLDYDDFLVQKGTIRIIREVIEIHPNLFDNEFYRAIEQDLIENIAAIEFLMIHSILVHRFPRYLELFLKTSLKLPHMIKSLLSITKKLVRNHFDIMERIIEELTKFIIADFNEDSFLKFKEILKPIPNYNLFKIVYSIANSEEINVDQEKKEKFKELNSFLIDFVPELEFLDLIKWLNEQLNYGPIKFKQITEKFAVENNDIIDILMMLIKKNKIEAILSENEVRSLNYQDSLVETTQNIKVTKNWYVKKEEDSNLNDIILNLSITNISSEDITKVNIIMEFPEDQLLLKKESDNQIIVKNIINRGKTFTIKWVYNLNPNYHKIPASSKIKLVIIYQKNEEVSSYKTEYDFLILG